MVKLTGVPVQTIPLPALVYDGVTVIVAVTGELVGFVAMKLAILLLPLPARPILVSSFVQLNTVPGTEPLNVTAVVEAPSNTAWFATGFTLGVTGAALINTGLPL